jgi:dolichol-phosphate mannosyltransferase
MRPDHPTHLPVSIVVPTFKEAENLPALIDRVADLRRKHGLDVQLLIMDDDSNDGSVDVVQARPENWVTIVVRTRDRGLSAAVLEGLRLADGNVLVCMDGDLSHPPEAIQAMLRTLEDGADFVIGSRYISGGSTADDWGPLRWINSQAATLMARPLTKVRDPMAGFFALNRSTFEQGNDFNPVGFKIGLELIVKCGCERVAEIPIRFEDRRFGKSKLTLRQQLLYLMHLRRLYAFKYPAWSRLAQVMFAGVTGAAVNLIALTALLSMHQPPRFSVATAILISLWCIFALSRRLGLSSVPTRSWRARSLGFFAAWSPGALLNYATTIVVLARAPELRPQLAALIGITIATSFNVAVGRHLVAWKGVDKEATSLRG